MKINYTVKRSARKTLSVYISYDNKIEVRAPYRVSDTEIERFLNKKSGWIERHLKKNGAINAVNRDIIDYKKILIDGRVVDLNFGSRNYIDGNGVTIKSTKSLKKLYIDNFGGDFLNGFYQICEAAHFKVNGVGFKDYKSRWGCCDGKNNIIFSYKLLMLNAGIRNYVIIHELCHTVHHNHSKDFWRLVEKFMPDYRKKRQELKGFAFIGSLY